MLIVLELVLSLYLMGINISKRAQAALICNENQIGIFSGLGLVKNRIAPSYLYLIIAVMPLRSMILVAITYY
jgi:hypothetical protein